MSAKKQSCAGDAGHVMRDDCKMVLFRIPMTVNRFRTNRVPLCPVCRNLLKGQWKYAKDQTPA